jgi:hypothetical protein
VTNKEFSSSGERTPKIDEDLRHLRHHRRGFLKRRAVPYATMTVQALRSLKRAPVNAGFAHISYSSPLFADLSQVLCTTFFAHGLVLFPYGGVGF